MDTQYHTNIFAQCSHFNAVAPHTHTWWFYFSIFPAAQLCSYCVPLALALRSVSLTHDRWVKIGCSVAAASLRSYKSLSHSVAFVSAPLSVWQVGSNGSADVAFAKWAANLRLRLLYALTQSTVINYEMEWKIWLVLRDNASALCLEGGLKDDVELDLNSCSLKMLRQINNFIDFLTLIVLLLFEK